MTTERQIAFKCSSFCLTIIVDPTTVKAACSLMLKQESVSLVASRWDVERKQYATITICLLVKCLHIAKLCINKSKKHAPQTDGLLHVYRYINEDGYKGGFEQGEVDAILAAVESDFAAWALCFAEAVVGPGHPAAVAKFATQLAAMRPNTALRVLRAVLTCDVRGVLPDVEARCTIVHCARDAVAPLAVARHMQRAVAGAGAADTVVIESSGALPAAHRAQRFRQGAGGRLAPPLRKRAMDRFPCTVLLIIISVVCAFAFVLN
jgi:hypothetical protein